MKFHNTLFTIVSLFVLMAGLAFAEEIKPLENLSALVDTALSTNPELKSSQARWRMFAGKAKQASALEDPMFMFKLQNLVARAAALTG